MRKHALIALLLAAAITPAFAGEVYVAGSVGRSSADINKGDIDNDLISAGATILGSNVDEHDMAYKAQVPNMNSFAISATPTPPANPT